MRKSIYAMLLVLLLPASNAFAQFCPGVSPWVFDDVPSSHPFCTQVTWIAQRGVTLGCSIIDANHRLYCPNSNVTRIEMAAFMYRLGFQNSLLQGGNAFGATGVFGTTDNQPLNLIAGGSRVMRYEPNAISPNLIGGSPLNSVLPGVRGATIAGGGAPPGGDPNHSQADINRVTDNYGTIGGGFANLAGDDAGSTTDSAFGTIGGGLANNASGLVSTIGGGVGNSAIGDGSTIAGGGPSSAGGHNSSIGGGYFNQANGQYSVVAGGELNVASEVAATVGGGASNEASGVYSTVGGGAANTASGYTSTVTGGTVNTASGHYSAVFGGASNTASGSYSFAAGFRAKSLAGGSFTFADSRDFDFASSTVNAFRVRATGGVRFVTEINSLNGAMTWSCLAVAGASWACSSDRDQKQNLRQLDGQAVLERLVAMPVFAWNPKGVNAHVNHYGPTAQDFHAAFGLGDDDTLIGTQDADGVALAAIQGLNAKLEAQLSARDATIDAQSREIAELRNAVESLLDRVGRAPSSYERTE